MEVIVVLALSIMVAIPMSIGISEIERNRNMNKFFLVLVSSMIGLCGLCGLAVIGLTKDPVNKQKQEKPKYELIQEPMYRKIK